MKEIISQLLEKSLKSCQEKYHWEINQIDFEVAPPKERNFGDISSNIVFLVAKKIGTSPKVAADKIIENIPENKIINKIEIAGGGFINFTLKEEYLHQELINILKEEKSYGRENLGENKKVLIEFVSANPTGPLHIGHGRGAAVGDVLSHLFNFFHYYAEKEYYINDSCESLQIENLLQSVEVRYRQQLGEDITLPEDAYRGEYIQAIAKKIIAKYGNNLNGFNEEVINFILVEILSEQKVVLKNFKIIFDNYFSENALYKNKEIENIIDALKEKSLLYLKEGAWWFSTGEEKDEVIVRSNGKPTYLASDIAYHQNKFKRGYEYLVNIWGADHHGHITRLKNAIMGLGFDKNKIEILIVQMVNLQEDGKKARLSKRQGDIITLQEVIDEVSADVARFFFLSKDISSQLNFDLNLAKKQEPDNPIYYIQYAYARICSVFKKARENKLEIDKEERVDFAKLISEEERALILTLLEFSATMKSSFLKRELHKICNYAISLSRDFHNFYEKCKIIDTNNLPLTFARLKLCAATKIIFSLIFNLLGIEAKERM